MMPAVLRHDGKIKMPGGGTMSTHSTKVPETNTVSTSMNSQRNNASLADLSVMSGDVSMYTIMDAQKF